MRRRAQQFSFKRLGIRAQGRTTLLKINCRDTRQILQTASMVAADPLRAQERADDGAPLVQPVRCGRDGHAPIVIRPARYAKGAGTFNPLADTFKLLTVHVSEGLAFPVVAVSGAGQRPGQGHDEADEARRLCVAATRSTRRLIMALSGSGQFAACLAGVPEQGLDHPVCAADITKTVAQAEQGTAGPSRGAGRQVCCLRPDRSFATGFPGSGLS